MNKQKDQKAGYGKILDAWIPSEDAGDPVGCAATSFTFSPVLFEEDCLGRFLQLETDATEDGPAYLIEREEKLSQLICAAALVDQHHAHGMRSLRWDLLPARLSPGILHAKVSLLLWSRRARLIVASANLTVDGYRRNHEVFGALDYFEGIIRSGRDYRLPARSRSARGTRSHKHEQSCRQPLERLSRTRLIRHPRLGTDGISAFACQTTGLCRTNRR